MPLAGRRTHDCGAKSLFKTSAGGRMGSSKRAGGAANWSLSTLSTVEIVLVVSHKILMI